MTKIVFGLRHSFVIGHSAFIIIFTNMIEIAAPDFDLEKTLNSGQVFHWEEAGGGFVGTIRDRAVYVERGTMQDERIVPLAECEAATGAYFAMVLIAGQGRRL